MSKSQRIENRINRIEDRFKKKVAKGKKGTDMDIELHERRIQALRDKSPVLRDKSPLNSMADIAAGVMGSGRSRKVKVDPKLVNKVHTLWADRMRDRDANAVPAFQTGVQGDVADNVVQTAPEPGLQGAPGGFDPGASVAAENMFGATLPGSFDRSMGG